MGGKVYEQKKPIIYLRTISCKGPIVLDVSMCYAVDGNIHLSKPRVTKEVVQNLRSGHFLAETS